jgi:hypothetical protein
MTSNTRSTPPTSSSASLSVDEFLRAEVERLLTVDSASGTDDVAAGLTCELRHHRPDCAGRAVREDALPRLRRPTVTEHRRSPATSWPEWSPLSATARRDWMKRFVSAFSLALTLPPISE